MVKMFEEKKYLKYLLFPLLLLASIIYQAVVTVRHLLYRFKILKSFAFRDLKIICVGNITVGGSGKSPLVIDFANYLLKQGFKIAILSRGYGRAGKGLYLVSDGKNFGSRELSGDEPYMIAKNVKVPVVVSEDRVKGVKYLKKQFQAQIILLDDGFQHLRLKKDLNLILVDSVKMFGNGFFLPLGILRDLFICLRDQKYLFLTKLERADFKNRISDLEQILKKKNLFDDKKIVYSSLESVSILYAHSLKPFIKPQKEPSVLVFSGIGNFASFLNTVKQVEYFKIVKSLEYRDHHQYTDQDIEKILKAEEIDYYLITEKDFYNLSEKQIAKFGGKLIILKPQIVYYDQAMKKLDKNEIYREIISEL